jgi:hypothetical protein
VGTGNRGRNQSYGDRTAETMEGTKKMEKSERKRKRNENDSNTQEEEKNNKGEIKTDKETY